MPIPIRQLRAITDDLPGARPILSPREQARQDQILAAATALLARFGRAGLTMAAFAAALRMSPATLRRYFPDMDSLLAEILMRHLQAIAAALGKVPFDAPDRAPARRAAYIAHTRTAFNAHTEPHLILLRERHALPPDLAEPVEKLRTLLADMLAPETPDLALTLLDAPELQPAQIETILAALRPKSQHAAPHPHPIDTPQPHPARPNPTPLFAITSPEKPLRPPPPPAWRLTSAEPGPRQALAP